GRRDDERRGPRDRRRVHPDRGRSPHVDRDRRAPGGRDGDRASRRSRMRRPPGAREHPPPPVPDDDPRPRAGPRPVRLAGRALSALGGSRRGVGWRRGARRALRARAVRLLHHHRSPLRVPGRPRRPARRRDRGRARDRPAVPPVPRLDGPRAILGRPAAGRDRRGHGQRARADRRGGGALPRPVAILDAPDRGRPVLAVLGDRTTHERGGGPGPAPRRAVAHPRRRDARRGAALPRAIRTGAAGAARGVGVARRRRVARSLRAPRGEGRPTRGRDRHRRRVVPELEPAPRLGDRAGARAPGRGDPRGPRGGRVGLERLREPPRRSPAGAARRPRQGRRRGALGQGGPSGGHARGSAVPGTGRDRLARTRRARRRRAVRGRRPRPHGLRGGSGGGTRARGAGPGPAPPGGGAIRRARSSSRERRRGRARSRRPPRRPADRRGGRMSTQLRERVRGVVGESAPRIDGVPKVKGTFAYGSDLWHERMLWGATLRSPHPHARIRRIEVGDAVAAPGVHAVLTADDVPGKKLYGLEFADTPVLAWDRVLYAGQPVAIVAAETPELARRAVARIVVEYEVLPAVTDMERALDPAAPKLHEWGNVLRHVRIEHGDPDAEAEVWVEGYYETAMQDQAPLGPEAGLAIPAEDGGVDLIVSTQWLHVDRQQIAPCLGLPEEKVRLTLAGVGGAFGSREDLHMQIHACLLALYTNRPVKMSYDRRESFLAHVHRHPSRIWMRTGASREGKLVNVRDRLLIDGGAFASSSPAVIGNATMFAAGPYEVPNALIEGTAVYTNNPPCG